MKRFLLLFIVIALAGCAMPMTPRYSVSANNIVSIKDLYGNSQNKIKIGKFTSDIKETTCRGSVIPIPDGLTIASFVRNGFSDELKMAGVYSDKSNTELRGRILNFDVECNTGTGHWITEIELTIGNGNPFIVKNIYDFEGTFGGGGGYGMHGRAQQSLNYALQDFYSKIIRDQKFQAAFSGVENK